LRRISDLAVAAGAPLAPQHCQPNLLIVTTDQPVRLLKALRARARGLFGHETPAAWRRFLARERPVMVWYNASLGPARGGAYTLADGVSQMFAAVPEVDQAIGSRIELNVVQSPSAVIEIIDDARAKGVTIGQLADYVAMVGLAQIDLDAKLGDAPTILRLFDEPAESRPDGISDWDRAFLKALYRTSQDSRLQRAAVTEQMLRDVAQ
jgi:hypothetical protein